MASAPAVAIISDSPLQRHRLHQAVGRYGLETVFCGEPDHFLARERPQNVKLWILSLADESDHPELLDLLLDDDQAPTLFGLAPAPDSGKVDYARWERRLFSKLREQLGDLEVLDNAQALEALDQPLAPTESPPALSKWIPAVEAGAPARDIWILGASLGGPAAIKEFLDQLPGGLPVGLVYAQHIDAHFSGVLARVLGRHAHYELVNAREGEPIRCGQVTMVPVDREMVLDEDGHIRFRDTAWPGPYGPSIDQVMLNMAEHNGTRCHAILFSGMGNDGAIAAPLLHAYGSRIWVQSSASCANSSMPESVAETGCVSFVGTPAQLAQHLIKTIEESCLLQAKQQRDSA